jgi:putative ABC transport system substrate-binding protein
MLVGRTNRRTFITALGSAVAWPLVARAQQPSRKARIGVLLPAPASYSSRINAFLEGLRGLGYEEGKTVTFEWRWWNDQVERLPELAAELVSLDVQAIVTTGTPAAKALTNATRSHTNHHGRYWRSSCCGTGRESCAPGRQRYGQ